MQKQEYALDIFVEQPFHMGRYDSPYCFSMPLDTKSHLIWMLTPVLFSMYCTMAVTIWGWADNPALCVIRRMGPIWIYFGGFGVIPVLEDKRK